MKKFIQFTLYFFILFIFLLSSVFGKDCLYLVSKQIIIDPGHGFLDPGTTYENIYEKDINLAIGLYLKKYLESYGASVLMTRDGDYDLSSPNALYRKKSDFDNRINLINNSNSNIYISIHLNYLKDKKYYGPQVFYNGKNIYFANIMQNVLNQELKSDRKVKLIPKTTYMYSKLKISGLLIECGFLSNDNERSKLITKEYQEKIAKSIALGILKYFS